MAEQISAPATITVQQQGRFVYADYTLTQGNQPLCRIRTQPAGGWRVWEMRSRATVAGTTYHTAGLVSMIGHGIRVLDEQDREIAVYELVNGQNVLRYNGESYAVQDTGQIDTISDAAGTVLLDLRWDGTYGLTQINVREPLQLPFLVVATMIALHNGTSKGSSGGI